jgi:hypothetical protein
MEFSLNHVYKFLLLPSSYFLVRHQYVMALNYISFQNQAHFITSFVAANANFLEAYLSYSKRVLLQNLF